MAVPEPFVVAFVVGVTPGKWARVWGERLPRHPLELRPLAQAEAVAALVSGDADVALLRLPAEHEQLSTIPLYAEQPVVVAPKGHAVEALDSLALADLDGETVLDQDWAAAVELVAANVGVAVMPQSVARALSRRDVVARPVTDAAETRIALAWVTAHTTPPVEEFIGIVRGRTANSSRGTPTPPALPEPKPPKRAAKRPRSGRGR
ncbi:MAG: LysR family transcriptional regulator [Microbacteriaceae bacterium]|nr:LysR family transcriptional regulator [Microbacteriaceae bacterium]